MKLQPAQWVMLPLGILTTLFLALAFRNEGGVFAVAAILPFVLLVVAYIFMPQINWQWYLRYPPQLAAHYTRVLEQVQAYQILSSEEKIRFRQRVALLLEATRFIRPAPPQADERVRNDLPIDLRVAVAAAQTQLTFGRDTFLTPKFENVIVYPHPFPTPQFPNHYHQSELYEADGVLIFNAHPLAEGAMSPQTNLHIGLYEYARVFRLQYPNIAYPLLGDDIWQHLERIGGVNKTAVERFINLPTIDDFGVTVCFFFSFPQLFHDELPDLYQLLQNIFRQNPLQAASPRC